MCDTRKRFVAVRTNRDKETLASEAMWFHEARHTRSYGPPRGYKAFRKWLSLSDKPQMGLTGFERKEAVNG